LWLLQVCIPNSKPRVFSSKDLTSIGTGAWSGCATGAAAGPPETVMVRQYGFPSCQGSAPSSAPASTGFVPPTAHRQVGLLKAVAAKPPLSGSPSSGECLLSWPEMSGLSGSHGSMCRYPEWNILYLQLPARTTLLANSAACITASRTADLNHTEGKLWVKECECTYKAVPSKSDTALSFDRVSRWHTKQW